MTTITTPAGTATSTTASTVRGAATPHATTAVGHVSLADIDRLAWAIEATGHLPDEADVARVVARARCSAVSPVLTGVLADPTEPEVARIRAFGLLALQLAASHPVAPATPPLAA